MLIDPPSFPESGEKLVREASYPNPPSVCGPTSSQYAGAGAAVGLSQPPGLTLPSLTSTFSVPHHLVGSRPEATGSSE